MSHGFELEPEVVAELPSSGVLGLMTKMQLGLNKWIMRLAMVALLAAAFILTWSVFSRYLFKAATDWQDEMAVFCLVGATFLCGAYVQSFRGHIGIDALAEILPAHINRIRQIFVDILSALFCAFFSWKSWTLLHEAWVDHQTTSSSWAPPLWIPYFLMAAGMTLLTLQIFLQVAAEVRHTGRDGR